MIICFIGDIHGRIFHAIAATILWQIRNNKKIDMIIQVGDFGVFPNPDDVMLNNKFVLQDPTELDFYKYLNANQYLQNDLLYAKQLLNCPINFIRGNHEDFQWLESRSRNGRNMVSIDNIDLVRYIPDGSIVDINGVRLAFLGGIETDKDEEGSINKKEYNSLIKVKPGYIDVLVTHDSPYGTGFSFKGDIQGSRKLTELIEAIQPHLLISGHYHHMIGPKQYGKTKYLGLNILIPPVRKDALGCVQPGSMAILDTDTNEIKFVEDEWLKQIYRNFDFVRFINELRNTLN